MITVFILINDRVIHRISARNINGDKFEQNKYELIEFEGTISHHYNDGAVRLAKKMLTILDNQLEKCPLCEVRNIDMSESEPGCSICGWTQ